MALPHSFRFTCHKYHLRLAHLRSASGTGGLTQVHGFFNFKFSIVTMLGYASASLKAICQADSTRACAKVSMMNSCRLLAFLGITVSIIKLIHQYHDALLDFIIRIPEEVIGPLVAWLHCSGIRLHRWGIFEAGVWAVSIALMLDSTAFRPASSVFVALITTLGFLRSPCFLLNCAHLGLIHPLPAQKKPPFPEEKGPSLRQYRAMGGGRLGVPAAWRRVLHIPGRLASARGRSWRLGARTSVHPPSKAREVRWAEGRTLAQVCYCRRP